MKSETLLTSIKRRWRVIMAVLGLGCAVACYLMVSTGVAPGGPHIPSIRESSTPRRPESIGTENFTTTLPQIAAVSPRPVVDGNPISAEDRVVIETSLKEIQSLLNQNERRTIRIINERDFDKFHEKLIEIPQPETATLAEASAGIKKGLALLPIHSKASRSFEAAALRLLAEYTDRPKPHKVLRVRVPHHPEGRISLDEYYVDDMRLIQSDRAGSYSVRLGSGKDSVIMRDDANFGGPDSWSKTRYGHLLMFEGDCRWWTRVSAAHCRECQQTGEVGGGCASRGWRLSGAASLR